MASQALDPRATVCSRRRVLGEAYLEALRSLHELDNSQALALIEKGSGLDRLEMALAHARRRRGAAMRALEEHIQAHGC